VDEEGKKTYGFSNAQIAYMTAKNPMGPFTYQGVVFKNQNDYFPGNGGNNHHSIFEFNGKYYITYHTRVVSNQQGLSGLNYRSTHVTEIHLLEDGSFEKLPKANYTSMEQVKCLNPYDKVEAETIATMGGLNTTQEGMISKTYGSGNMVLSEIESGDWVAVYGADFGETGATAFTASVKAEKGTTGAIQIRLDAPDGEAVGTLVFGDEADGKNYYEVTADLTQTVTGEHDLVFVFLGEGYTVDYWQFR
jgi:arabinoxylan arabinofuranohydrolase